jgi:hypothetical protein
MNDALFWMGASMAALMLTIVATAELIIAWREWREARRLYKTRRWSD